MAQNQKVSPKKGDKLSFFSQSDEFRRQLAKAERESTEKGGKSMAEMLVEMAKGNDKRTAIQAQKVFWSLVVVPVAERPVDLDRPESPGIYLPEKDTPPNVVPMQKKGAG